jgi:hypothetical protein
VKASYGEGASLWQFVLSLSSAPETEDVDFESIDVVGGIWNARNKFSRLERARSREKAGEVCRLKAPAGCWSSGGVERLGREWKNKRLQSTPAAAGGQFNGSDGGAKLEDNWKSNRVRSP